MEQWRLQKQIISSNRSSNRSNMNLVPYISKSALIHIYLKYIVCSHLVEQVWLSKAKWFYLNVLLIRPPSRREAWLSLSSARLITTFRNPNVGVNLIINTCLVRTWTNKVILLEYRGSTFKSIKRYFYQLVYNWHEEELPVVNHRSVSTRIFGGMSKSDLDYHNWQYLQLCLCKPL